MSNPSDKPTVNSPLAQALKQAKPLKTPPFPVGAKVRYTGPCRLFGGYVGSPVLWPSMEAVISDVGGEYSIYVMTVDGIAYEQAIGPSSKADWVAIA